MKLLIHKNNLSFTLIELLVVLALVAILSVVVILTLNPAELIKQARDSNRLSDLATINTALNLFSTDVTGGFMGTSTVVYVSIPSTTSTCSNLGLPTLPSGYTYNCVTATSTRNTDGTGWIPVNFQRISSNSPISQLPIDPINTTSTRLYYIYVAGGSWELSASVEATKNKLGGSNDLTSKDGGSATSQYEIGNNLNLNPIETGDFSLVGYWNFEEGPNATSTDRSGYGNHGAWYGTSTAEQRYATGRDGQYSGYFNGSSDYFNSGTTDSYSFVQNSGMFTISAWVKFSNYLVTPQYIMGSTPSSGEKGFYYGMQSRALAMYITKSGGGNLIINAVSSSTLISDNNWHYISAVGNGVNIVFYVDGIANSASGTMLPFSTGGSTRSLTVGKINNYFISFFGGWIDNLQIYNRTLSATEVLALYNATK